MRGAERTRAVLGFLAFAACTSSCSRPGGVVDASHSATRRISDASPAAAAVPFATDAAAGSTQPTVAAQTDGAQTKAVVPPPPAPLTSHVSKGFCAALARPGACRGFLAEADLATSFVDGDDFLALVNRSPIGALSPDYAPSDLVDVRTGRGASVRDCERLHCLRRDAREAIQGLLEAMRTRGFPGRIESAFRSYPVQCNVFLTWAHKSEGGCCAAVEQSALPGHSQHQLGTTVDLFTEAWARDGRGVFRSGFGCTDAGGWLAEHSWEHGFVLPYPIHPDDRGPKACLPRTDLVVPINPKTGYRNEAWHLRYVGKDHALAYHAAWASSGPGTPDEITLEQWLRQRGGRHGDVDLPVCDGCSCGACATLARGERAPCKTGALRIDAEGRPRPTERVPTIDDVTVRPKTATHPLLVEVRVGVPDDTLTQPPIVTPKGPVWTETATYLALAPYPRTAPRRYDDLPQSFRIGIEVVDAPSSSPRFPWRVSLAKASLADVYNRANALLPAMSGAQVVSVPVDVPSGARALRVALLRMGEAHAATTVTLPEEK